MGWGFVDDETAHQFHDELLQLIARYDHLMDRVPDDDAAERGFDINAPEAIDGIVMMISSAKLDGNWRRTFHYRPPGQNTHQSLGLALDLYEWFRHEL